MKLSILYLVGYIISFIFMAKARYKDLSYYNCSGQFKESNDELLTKSVNYSILYNIFYPIYWVMFLLKYFTGRFILKLNYKINYKTNINHIFRTI